MLWTVVVAVLLAWGGTMWVMHGLGSEYARTAFNMPKTGLMPRPDIRAELKADLRTLERDLHLIKPDPPQPARPEVPAPSPEPPAVEGKPAGGRFAVQTAVAVSAADAEDMVGKLKARGFDAYYYAVERNGRTQYRVRAGHFADMSEAREAVRRLESAGYRDPFISRLTD